jgi:hypothetical protein
MRLPFPVRSSNTQRSSRRWRCLTSRRTSSSRRRPQTNNSARRARSRRPMRVVVSETPSNRLTSFSLSHFPRRWPDQITQLVQKQWLRVNFIVCFGRIVHEQLDSWLPHIREFSHCLCELLGGAAPSITFHTAFTPRHRGAWRGGRLAAILGGDSIAVDLDGMCDGCQDQAKTGRITNENGYYSGLFVPLQGTLC